MKTDFIAIQRTPLDERVLGCTFGNYPWDEWERRALAAGVAKRTGATWPGGDAGGV